MAGVTATVEAIPIPNVKPLNGSKHLSISVPEQDGKAVLHLLTLSRELPVPSQRVATRRPLVWDGLDGPANPGLPPMLSENIIAWICDRCSAYCLWA